MRQRPFYSIGNRTNTHKDKMADNLQTKTSETMKEFLFITKDREATTSKDKEIFDTVKEDDCGINSERSMASVSAESQENMVDEKFRPVLLVQNAGTGVMNSVDKEEKGERLEASRSILDESETQKCDNPLNKSVLTDEKDEELEDAKENDEKAPTSLNEPTGSESSIVHPTSTNQAEDDDECLEDMRIFEISQDASGQPKGMPARKVSKLHWVFSKWGRRCYRHSTYQGTLFYHACKNLGIDVFLQERKWATFRGDNSLIYSEKGILSCKGKIKTHL